jgi:hypothetical protein
LHGFPVMTDVRGSQGLYVRGETIITVKLNRP